MANEIVKKTAVTRVHFALTTVENGVPQCKEMPMVVFRGILNEEKVLRNLRKTYGVNAAITIINIDAGTYRFVMDFDTFIRNAYIQNEVNEDAQTEAAAASDESTDESGQGETADENPSVETTAASDESVNESAVDEKVDEDSPSIDTSDCATETPVAGESVDC